MAPAHETWSKEACDGKHRWITWGFGLLTVLLGAIAGGSALSLNMAWSAANIAENTRLAHDAAVAAVVKDLAVEKNESQQHWEATQRQITGLRDQQHTDHNETMAAIKENRERTERLFERLIRNESAPTGIAPK